MNEKAPKNQLTDFFDQIREASVVEGGVMRPLHSSIAETIAGGQFNLCNSNYRPSGGGGGGDS